MRRFGWVTWFIALVIVFAAYFGISYLLGRVIYGIKYTVFESSWMALFFTTLTYWIAANRKPRFGGTLRIDTTRDDKDIWRFEIDDLSKFTNNEFVTVRIVKKKVVATSDEIIEGGDEYER